MVVRIRLARHGTRNNPFHHIVVINQRVARNAKPIELVGVFDPIPRAPETPFPKYPFQNDGTLLKSSILPDLEKVKKVEWSVERTKYWISVGAQPSKAVMRLLDMGGINVPFRRSPKPGPLSQGDLRKKREGKEGDLTPPIIGQQRPPETATKPTSVDFEAEDVSRSTPLDTTPSAVAAPVP